jgi:hypothetical protein
VAPLEQERHEARRSTTPVIIVSLVVSLVGGWFAEILSASLVEASSVVNPAAAWLLYLFCGSAVSWILAALIWKFARTSRRSSLLVLCWLPSWSMGWAIGAHFDSKDFLAGLGAAFVATSVRFAFKFSEPRISQGVQSRDERNSESQDE